LAVRLGDDGEAADDGSGKPKRKDGNNKMIKIERKKGRLK